MNKLIAILTVMLVLASVEIAGATGEVIWHLRSDDATGFSYPIGHEYDLNMTKEGPTSTIATWYKIGPGNESWWYTNQSAERDLTFPAGDWNASFLTKLDDTSDKGRSVKITLWNLSETGYATEITDTSEVISKKGEESHIVIFSASKIDMKEGDRIAISFHWTSEANERLWIGCDSNSKDSTLTSPQYSPPWPVPELATLTLVSLGLVSLVGYAYAFRNKNG